MANPTPDQQARQKPKRRPSSKLAGVELNRIARTHGVSFGVVGPTQDSGRVVARVFDDNSIDKIDDHSGDLAWLTAHVRRLMGAEKADPQIVAADILSELTTREAKAPAFVSGEKITGENLDAALEQLALASTDILGPSTQALRWLQEHPVPALDGHTSAHLIAEGLGNAVVDYLDELRNGSRG